VYRATIQLDDVFTIRSEAPASDTLLELPQLHEGLNIVLSRTAIERDHCTRFVGYQIVNSDKTAPSAVVSEGLHFDYAAIHRFHRQRG
jgi:hypothetical protein